MLCMNGLFLAHFSDTTSYEKTIANLSLENQRNLLEIEMQEIEMQEFKQEVADIIPEYSNAPKDYSGRQLASVLGGYVNPPIDESLSKILLRRAKSLYNEKDFVKAKKALKKYITKYPHSTFVPESYLMLLNIEFKNKNYEQTMKYIDKLVSSYPDNEITAYGLLVLGEIMERQERIEDASVLYKTIINSFEIKQVQRKARKELKNIGLDDL